MWQHVGILSRFRTQVAITTHSICSIQYLSVFFLFPSFPFGSPILLKSSALLWFLFKELAYALMSICRMTWKKTKPVLKRSQVLESIWPSGMSSVLSPVPDKVKIHQFCDMNLKLSATACDSVGFSDEWWTNDEHFQGATDRTRAKRWTIWSCL